MIDLFFVLMEVEVSIAVMVLDEVPLDLDTMLQHARVDLDIIHQH